MNIKLFFLTSLLVVPFTGCSAKKEVNYEPGANLTITSIEMSDEYGDCTLLQLGNYDILVDSGAGKDATHVKTVLNNKISDKTIELLVVTHPHGDHIGGIINGALDDFTIKNIVDYGYTYNATGSDSISNPTYVKAYVNKRNAWVNSGATYSGIKEKINEESVFEIDKEQNFSIRWLKNNYYYGVDEVFPNSSVSSDNPNITSVSFVLEYKYWNIVMCGDIDQTYGESSVVENHEDLFSSDKKRVLLKATHHASSTSMGYNFLDWCNPEMMFISAAMLDSIAVPNQVALGSSTGQQNHPNSSTVRRIKKKCTNTYWNAINGDITFVTDGVNDMTMSGAGRNKDYYIKDSTELASRENEKNTKFFDSEFYKYY